jgi:hypothetical protein
MWGEPEMPKTSEADFWRGVKRILRLLGDEPRKYTEWRDDAATANIDSEIDSKGIKHMFKVNEKKLTTPQFHNLCKFALKYGYVERISRGKYRRTEEGTRAFEKLSDPTFLKIVAQRMLRIKREQKRAKREFNKPFTITEEWRWEERTLGRVLLRP